VAVWSAHYDTPEWQTANRKDGAAEAMRTTTGADNPSDNANVVHVVCSSLCSPD